MHRWPESVDLFPFSTTCLSSKIFDTVAGHGGWTMHSNGGTQTTVLIGDYEPLGLTVWYNPDSLVNILSLSQVEAKFCVTLDSRGCDTSQMLKRELQSSFPTRRMFDFQADF